MGEEDGRDLASRLGEGWKTFELCSPFFGRRVDDGRHGSVRCGVAFFDAGGTERAGEEEEGEREDRKAEEDDDGGSQGGNQDEQGQQQRCGCSADENEQRDRWTVLGRAQGRLPRSGLDKVASAVPDGSSSPSG